MRWPWQTPQAPSRTSSGTRGAMCEWPGCEKYPLIFLNGCTLLCWDHYAEMMPAVRRKG